MNRLALAAVALLVTTGCALKGSSVPGASIDFAKADYTVLGATNAEECGTYILGIDWGHLFKNEGAMIAPGSFTMTGTAGLGAAGVHNALLAPEGRRALYMSLEKMPDATHLLAPRVNVEIKGVPLGPSPYAPLLFGQRCATVEARGVKIGDRPTVNQ
jgi:hypothetical protein